MRFKKSSAAFMIFAVFLLIFMFQSCRDDNVTFSPAPNIQPEGQIASGFSQVNLVADVAAYDPVRIDPLLVNAWGIAVTATGRFWISAAETGVSVIYDTAGNTVLAPVSIPGASGPGSPTGQILNTTTNFRISGVPARFLFASEDGTISGWISGTSAVIVVNNSASDAVYKGLAIGSVNGHNYLYAADFHNAKVDVFDTNFAAVTGFQFDDPLVPPQWAPFNIANINGSLFITYAKQLAPDFEDDDPGPGRGMVDVYSTSGSLMQRFAIRGTLNSPWGIAVTTTAFDGGNNVLIGNFGDGRINIFDMDGHFRGQLRDTRNMAISIDGLWGLAFTSLAPGRLYFAAGPEDEEHGLFGYLKR